MHNKVDSYFWNTMPIVVHIFYQCPILVALPIFSFYEALISFLSPETLKPCLVTKSKSWIMIQAILLSMSNDILETDHVSFSSKLLLPTLKFFAHKVLLHSFAIDPVL